MQIGSGGSVSNTYGWIEVEPYWNVNECYCAIHMICTTIEVEPYWNVNVAGALGYSIEDTIEVEPYWNVNLNACPSIRFRSSTD